MREITEIYKRDGDKFTLYHDDGYKSYTLDIEYESIGTLVLHLTSGFQQAIVSIDKFSKDFTSINLQTPTVFYISTGQCEFVE